MRSIDTSWDLSTYKELNSIKKLCLPATSN